MASLTGSQIISLVGYQGSGKTTLGKKLAKAFKTSHIETSDVVKNLHKDIKKRAELASTSDMTKQNPNWLGSAIEDEIQNKNTVVLTGVREKEVHKYLQHRGATMWVCEIVSDAPIRFQRLLKLGKVESAEEFLEQELREKKLGLDEVMEKAQFTIPTSDETKPEAIVLKIVDRLHSKGMKNESN